MTRRKNIYDILALKTKKNYQHMHFIYQKDEWHTTCYYRLNLKIKVGIRPMDTFYTKYTIVFHTQDLADV